MARQFFLTLTLAMVLSACASAAEIETDDRSSALSTFSSPYFIFQYGPGENWQDGKPVLEQDLSGHFAYMAGLERTGVLVHGGPLDRGDGEYTMGVIKSDGLSEARTIILNDPAIISGVQTLLSIDRWIAMAGSGEGIDKNLVGPG